jgi:transcription initiation factor TFIID TATA-box-binding protein
MEIQNVVASSSLGQELDLNQIEARLEGAEYNPQQFPGLVYRIKEPKTATLLFRSGKIVCTGGKSKDEVIRAVNTVIEDLKQADVVIKHTPVVEVQNIVASSDLGDEINLNTVAITLGLEKVEYEPEQFPGLVYRLDDPKVVVLLFSSGKMVITGAKIPNDVIRAVDKIAEELRDAGLMN